MPLTVQLLPTSAGDRSQIQHLTTFLVNGTIAIDAGSLGLALDAQEIARIGHVVLTHSHLDHIASLPIAIVEAFVHLKKPMRIYGTAVVLNAVRDHLMNGVLWPDFSQIKLPQVNAMACELVTIEAGRSFEIEGVVFTPVPVNHEVPTIGLIVDGGDAAVAFTSDTTITDEIWIQAGRRSNLKGVFVDCSFPDEMQELALRSGHLTPAMVVAEVAKLGRPIKTHCVHIKAQTRGRVIDQIKSLADRGIEALEIGRVYRF